MEQENLMSVKEVVALFLRSNEDMYLVQLRDNIPGIEFPGHWGLFGGTIEPGESFREAAFRELKEEIYYVPVEIHAVRKYMRGTCLVNVCFAKLECPVSALRLNEGFDFGLFSHEEILSGYLFSQKLRSFFPIAEPVLGFFKDYLIWARTSKVSLQ